jgi:hypothetical protein
VRYGWRARVATTTTFITLTRTHTAPEGKEEEIAMGGFFSKSPYDAPADVASKHFPAFLATLPSLVGKTVAITGTTTGTGFVTALACAQKGASVGGCTHSRVSDWLCPYALAALPLPGVTRLVTWTVLLQPARRRLDRC